MDEPSIGEVLRRVDDAVAQLARLADRLERDYVTREAYQIQREADRDDVAEIIRRLDKSDTQRAADRRLLMTSLVAPLLVALVLLYVAAQFGGAQ